MKLITKKEFFDQIKAGTKTFDYRDAHITFVCEETGETLRKEITRVDLMARHMIPSDYRCLEIFEDDMLIVFGLKNDS